jgi:phosphopantothenoylcysteine decarboxylase/phosphopantothenate--cysteine ligase
MAEPEEIVTAIEAALSESVGPLGGVKALVTAGPTQEPLDPVRFLANRSSGKQGYAIAGALADAGADTTLVSGPTELVPPSRARLLKVQTAREMLAACESVLPVDVAVFTAAVSDWRPQTAANSKIKKNGAPPQLALAENPDVLSTIARGAKRPAIVIGFAAETDDVVSNAKNKRTKKSADWIVANDVSPSTGIMGGDNNTVHLITAAGVEDWPPMSKVDVARRLASRIAQALGKAA